MATYLSSGRTIATGRVCEQAATTQRVRTDASGKPSPWIRIICFKSVLLPDAPAPGGKGRRTPADGQGDRRECQHACIESNRIEQ